MTRRILASFLAVLLALLALVVLPLGLTLTSRERHDFAATTGSAASALAAVAEEHLGDRAGPPGASAEPLRLPAEAGDGVVVIDNVGTVISRAGRAISPRLLDAVRAGRRPTAPNAVVRIATVGEPDHPDGTAILVRDTEPLNHRIALLWLEFGIAAIITLAVGAFVAARLAQWISRPMRDLQAVAERMGHGDISARSSDQQGAPEVRSLARAFNEMATRIGALLDSQRVMTADVSHQIRTPLSALRLRLELLAEDTNEETRLELLGALREISRLSRLADGLLAVARAEAVVVDQQAVAVETVVGERVDLWRPVAQDRGVGLQATTSPARATTTPGHLEQILDNLLANALDALERGGKVHVSVTAEADDVVLTVADDGPGMSAELRASAFERFVSDRSGPASAGLGLAIVARLVAADHGRAELRETPGGGLTAIVRLPAAGRSRSGGGGALLPARHQGRAGHLAVDDTVA
ncbi:MAG: hypothetical protein QOJ03_957 [Frankiaceae bacterium]|nr:hypothetical protein [Frankiaceae bacterium]